jgi:hypothetical protein
MLRRASGTQALRSLASFYPQYIVFDREDADANNALVKLSDVLIMAKDVTAAVSELGQALHERFDIATVQPIYVINPVTKVHETWLKVYAYDPTDKLKEVLNELVNPRYKESAGANLYVQRDIDGYVSTITFSATTRDSVLLYDAFAELLVKGPDRDFVAEDARGTPTTTITVTFKRRTRALKSLLRAIDMVNSKLVIGLNVETVREANNVS